MIVPGASSQGLAAALATELGSGHRESRLEEASGSFAQVVRSRIARMGFFHFHDTAPEASVNNGELVDPPVPLAEVSLRPRGGGPMEDPFSDKWTILVVAPDREPIRL